MVTLLAIIAVLIIAILVFVVSLIVGGIGTIIAYGDIIVAALIIIWLLRKIFKKRT